jgi:hypothetical protein
MATRKTAAAKSTGTALTLWEAEMAEAAVAQASTEKPSGFTSSISFKGGRMKIDDSFVEGDELDVVILAVVHENQWYTGKYDPNVIQTPDCYAIGLEDEDMTPHVDSADKQGDDDGKCLNCEHNKMGSADTGRGKACKNVRRIVCVPADALASVEAFEAAEMRTAKIPVTSVRNLSKYLRNKLVEEIKRPTYGVVTTMSCGPHAKYQVEVNFEFAELVNFDQALYEAVKRRAKEALDTLLASSYPKFAEEQVIQPPAKGSRAPKYANKAKAAPAAPAAPARRSRKAA